MNHPAHHYRYQLQARDPATLRAMTRDLSGSAVRAGGPILDRIIEETTLTIARSWTSRYRVPFPIRRITWEIRQQLDPRWEVTP